MACSRGSHTVDRFRCRGHRCSKPYSDISGVAVVVDRLRDTDAVDAAINNELTRRHGAIATHDHQRIDASFGQVVGACLGLVHDFRGAVGADTARQELAGVRLVVAAENCPTHHHNIGDVSRAQGSNAVLDQAKKSVCHPEHLDAMGNGVCGHRTDDGVEAWAVPPAGHHGNPFDGTGRTGGGGGGSGGSRFQGSSFGGRGRSWGGSHPGVLLAMCKH
mmetsp:Transcript_14537/g.37398  ORF Transcript_14537/g.37398 Transcript_14537/m.37398 type:complete len:218 (-) Transcript_14537:77-730(-)